MCLITFKSWGDSRRKPCLFISPVGSYSFIDHWNVSVPIRFQIPLTPFHKLELKTTLTLMWYILKPTTVDTFYESWTLWLLSRLAAALKFKLSSHYAKTRTDWRKNRTCWDRQHLIINVLIFTSFLLVLLPLKIIHKNHF